MRDGLATEGCPGAAGALGGESGTPDPETRSAGAQQAQLPPSNGPGSLSGRFPRGGTVCCLQPGTRGALLPRDASASVSSFAAPG